MTLWIQSLPPLEGDHLASAFIDEPGNGTIPTITIRIESIEGVVSWAQLPLAQFSSPPEELLFS